MLSPPRRFAGAVPPLPTYAQPLPDCAQSTRLHSGACQALRQYLLPRHVGTLQVQHTRHLSLASVPVCREAFDHSLRRAHLQRASSAQTIQYALQQRIEHCLTDTRVRLALLLLLPNSARDFLHQSCAFLSDQSTLSVQKDAYDVAMPRFASLSVQLQGHRFPFGARQRAFPYH